MAPAEEPSATSVLKRPEGRALVPNAQTERDDVLCVIRHVFSDGPPRDRAVARHGILQNDRGQLSLLARSIEQYDCAFLKDQSLAALGRTWTDRDDAIRAVARWLGFVRTGSTIEDTARSLINGLLHEGRDEADADRLRRCE